MLPASMRLSALISISHGPPHNPRSTSEAASDTSDSAIRPRSGRDRPMRSTSAICDSGEDWSACAAGCFGTSRNTAIATTAPKPAEIQNPARQPQSSTTKASGLADSSMPILPIDRMIPDHRPNRAADICLAASVIGHISMPEVATPSRNWPNRKLSGPVASPEASAPTMVPHSRLRETGRTPKRSIAAPTGICEAAKAK